MANTLANVNTLSKFGTLQNGKTARAKFFHLKGRYRVSFIGFGIDGQGSTLTAEMVEFAQPSGSFNKQSVNYVNGEIHYAGKWSWQDISFKLFNTYDNSVYRALLNQLQRQRDFTEQTTGDAPSNYKFQCIFENTDGHQSTLSYWIIEGCWLQDLQIDGSSNNSDEASQITCKMVFDNATLYDKDGVAVPTSSAEVVSDLNAAYVY